MTIWKFDAISNDHTCFLPMDEIDEADEGDYIFQTDGKHKSWPVPPRLTPLLETRKKNQKPLADINYVAPGSVVLNPRAYAALKDFLLPFGEFLEVACFNTRLDGDVTTSEAHWFYNVTNMIACIDYANSGKIGSGVSEAVFFPDAIAHDVQVFKDPLTARAVIYLSEAGKVALEEIIAGAQLIGAQIVAAEVVATH